MTKRIKIYESGRISKSEKDRLMTIVKNTETVEVETIIDILELYNVYRYLNEVNLIDISSKVKINFNSFFNKNVQLYFKDWYEEDHLDCLSTVFLKKKVNKKGTSDFSKYREDYFGLISNFNLFEHVTSDKLFAKIRQLNVHVSYLLKDKYYNKNYGLGLKSFFLSDCKNTELVLNNYTVAKDKRTNIPSNITKEEMYTLFEEYLSNPMSNLNYIKVIMNGIQGIQEIEIDSRMKYRAKQLYEKKVSEIFDDKEDSDSTSVKIFSSTEPLRYTNIIDYNNSKSPNKIFIDLDFLLEEDSKESLLDSLMYMSRLFNKNWILDICQKTGYVLSAFFGVKTLKHYNDDLMFNEKINFILMELDYHLEIYNHNFNTKIEELYDYFFIKYSKENFDITWLKFSFADDNEDLSNRINILCTNLERLIKQWNLLVTEDRIEPGIYEFETTPRFQDLKSKIPNKYIYLNSTEGDNRKIQHLLFSEGSTLVCVSGKFEEKTFYDLLIKHRVNMSCFDNYQNEDVLFLIQKGLISVDSNEDMFITKQQNLCLCILFFIFQYDAITYHNMLDYGLSKYYNLEIYQETINDLQSRGIVYSDSSLLSKSESDFFDYVFNDSKFDNSIGIRNKYNHGSTITGDYKDYLFIVLLFLILIIKINEELNISLNIRNTSKSDS